MTTNRYLFPFFCNPCVINKLVEVLGVDINRTLITNNYLAVDNINNCSIKAAINKLNKTEEVKTYTTNYEFNLNNETLIDFLYKVLSTLYPSKSIINIISYTHDLVNSGVTAKYTVKTRDTLDDLVLKSLKEVILPDKVNTLIQPKVLVTYY